MSRESEIHWGQDTIYCEATCDPEEVFYEGSDDDDYESPSVRRMRYEAAGRRFLNGDAPLMLSSSLRGPFEESSGWRNPWRSKRTTTKQAIRPIPESPCKKKAPASPNVQPTADKPECHLPSPESLKQASVKSHPYLQEEDLNRVQAWRDTVQPTKKSRRAANVCDLPSVESTSTKKRRAKSSDWLRTDSDKRRKVDSPEPVHLDTPSNRRSRKNVRKIRLPIGSAERDSTANTSFQSAPGRMVSSTRTPTKRQRNLLELDDDELGSAVKSIRPSASFSHGSRRVTSPVKRLSPKRKIWSTNRADTVESEDELAQDKPADIKAAQTLSSPVSLKNGNKQVVEPVVSTAAKPSSPPPVSISSDPGSECDQDAPVVSQPSNPNPKESTETELATGETAVSPQLEIQQDQSFCPIEQTEPEAVESDVVLDEAATCPAVISRPSSPLSSISSSHGATTWSGLSPGSKAPMAIGRSSSPLSSISSSHGATTWSGLSPTSKSPVTINRPSSPLSSISSAFGSPTWSGLSLSSDDNVVLDLEMSSSHASDAGDAMESTSMQAKGPMIEHGDSVSQLDFGNSKPGSDADSDNLSEISEPSITGSCMEELQSSQERAIAEKAAEEDAPDVMGVDSVVADVEQEAQNAMVDTSNLVLDESQKSPVDVDMEDCPEIPEIAQEAGTTADHTDEAGCLPKETPPTTADVSMTDLQKPEAKQDECLSEQCTQSVQEKEECLVEDESLSTQETTEVTAAESAPSFSFKSMFQRFVSSGSWGKSEVSDAEPMQDPEHLYNQPSACQETPETRTQEIEEPTKPADLSSAPSQNEQRQPSLSPITSGAVENTEALGAMAATPQQQSPWSKSQATQNFGAGMDIPSTAINDTTFSSELNVDTCAQSPWAPGVDGQRGNADNNITSNTEAQHHQNAPLAEGCALSPTVDAQESTPPRPSTPEFEFLIQPFSAFMTPSPEHRARSRRSKGMKISGSRLPGSHKMLASALKNPWCSSNSNKRVSWGPLPGENAENSPSSQAKNGSPVCLKPRERGASPPPTTAIEDLPTTGDSGFQGHFKAIAKRANEAPPRVLPSEAEEAEETGADSAPGSSMEDMSFIMQQPSTSATPAEPIFRFGEELRNTQDGEDLTDQVLEDLQELLQPYDLDVELEESRKVSDFDDMSLCV